MSLPPGFFDELRTRLSLSQVVGRKVTWDTKKSNMGKGDMWAPCPFHQEKTASFHVDDQKGFYYCFGCQAKGDVFNFVKETENVSFMEAVELLAREAGMPMPERDPRAQEKSDKRTELLKVTEAANRFFTLSLQQQGGAQARAYLDRRGMAMETRAKFEIGYAPAGNALLRHLADQGISEQLAIEAGVVAKPDDGRGAYDFFRDRIIFPIRDGRGQLISFGGRAMDPNARAKYLNGPETALFDKGRALYNQAPARAAAGKGQPFIVAEGYMDVIALSAAGFESAVAPLGTAITDNQLHLCWRMSPEPIIALDGDKAGLRAAYRAIDLAMPLLEAGKSLRFAIMPEGQDPDDLIKAGGAAQMQTVLDGAVPMVKLLWRRETEGKNFDSPERRAMLDKALRTAIAPITDASIKKHYGQILNDMRFELFRGARPTSARTPYRGGARMGPTDAVKSSLLVTADSRQTEHMREAVVLALLVSNPALIERFVVQLESLTMSGDGHGALLHALLTHGFDVEAPQLRENLEAEVGRAALDTLMAHPHVQIVPPVRAADLTTAEQCLIEELTKLKAIRGHSVELSESMEALLAAEDEQLTWRLKHAAEARNKAVKAEAEDRTQFDVADNGLELSRDERAKFNDLLNKLGQKAK